jgi:hypothetical protein
MRGTTRKKAAKVLMSLSAADFHLPNSSTTPK